MKVLAFDTSTAVLSICLKVEEKVYETTKLIGLKHVETLVPEIKNLLENAGIEISELDLIICSKGPGSFTGLRIGMSTAKGLSAGGGIPLVSIPTLDSYIYGLNYFEGIVLPVIDARKNRFYTAFYKNGMKSTDFLDISVQDIENRLKNEYRILITGPDADIFYKQLSDKNRYILNPLYLAGTSINLLLKGIEHFTTNGGDTKTEGPLYIRKSEAELSLTGEKL